MFQRPFLFTCQECDPEWFWGTHFVRGWLAMQLKSNNVRHVWQWPGHHPQAVQPDGEFVVALDAWTFSIQLQQSDASACRLHYLTVWFCLQLELTFCSTPVEAVGKQNQWTLLHYHGWLYWVWVPREPGDLQTGSNMIWTFQRFLLVCQD